MNMQIIYWGVIIILVIFSGVAYYTHSITQQTINEQSAIIKIQKDDINKLQENITIIRDYANQMVTRLDAYYNYTIVRNQEAKQFMAAYYCLHDLTTSEYVASSAYVTAMDCHSAALKGRFDLVEEELSVDSYRSYVSWREYFTFP